MTAVQIRLGLSALGGAFVAFGLFVLMTVLIDIGGVDLKPPNLLEIEDVVQPPPEIEVTEEFEPPDRPEVESPPEEETPPPPQETQVTDLGAGVGVSRGSGGFDVGAIVIQRGAGQRQPIFRVEPSYPPRAASRGIQGYVLVFYDIDEEGRVRNARIVESEPRGVFDSAALRAVSKWRYTPEFDEDGKPTYVTGVGVRFPFQLTE